MSKHPALTSVLAVVLVALSVAAGHAGARPTARASVDHGTIAVAGKPFFPVMLIDQCGADAAERAARLGVNVILNESCTTVPARDQLDALADDQLGVLPIRGRSSQGTNLLGWTYPDEPDDNGWTAASLARRFDYRRGSPDGLLSFVTTTSAFFTGPDRATRAQRTRAFARVADVAGFDLYPLNHCRTDLTEVFDAQRQFVRLAEGSPTFQWIETGAIHPGYCGGVQVTPAQLTAEAWLAVAGGARGIGFFTHTWSPQHDEFGVPPAVQQAMSRFASTAAAILPGLTGRTLASTVDTPAVKALARRGEDGRTYVVAVNTLTSVVPARFEVHGLHAPKLRVVAERRDVAVYGGKFEDTFQPLGVHVYAVR